MGAERDHTQSDTHTHTHTHTLTHTATGTEPEAQRLQVNLCAGRHADTPVYGNTNTGLSLGTRVPQTSPQHTHTGTYTLKHAYTRSPSCAAPLRAMRPLRASCRRQAAAPAALEPSWCQHCHRVATGAQCPGRKAGMLASGDETGEL